MATETRAPTLEHSQPRPRAEEEEGLGEDTSQDTQQSSQQTLAQAVHARRAEYIRPHKIRVKVGSWNVAALQGTEKDIGAWFVEGKAIAESLAGLKVTSTEEPHRPGGLAADSDTNIREGIEHQEARSSKYESTAPQNDHSTIPSGEDIGLYVLGLQEIVDINSASEALKPFNDSGPSTRWKKALEEALPEGYKLVAEQQLHGLYLLIYASPSIAPIISSVSTSNVGTGLLGYMGNKGATTARIMLGETTRLVFINSHLAAGAEKGSLDRRNWDAEQIVQRTKYTAVDDGLGVSSDASEAIGDEDFAWWFGDLNYRLEGIPADDVRRLLMLHTRNEYDISQASESKIEKEIANSKSSVDIQGTGTGNESQSESTKTSSFGRLAIEKASSMIPTHSQEKSGPSDKLDPHSDPASLQTTINSLLTHDQLRQQQKDGKAFQDGWREGQISFLPTYKYDVGSVGLFDSSEKKRGPSWCDRILFRTRNDMQTSEEARQLREKARKKDEDMKARGMDDASKDEEVLFDYDPDTDGADDNKYDNDYDPSEDDMAGAETVVTKEGYEDKIRLDIYTSHQRILSSDHKPLVAVFSLVYDGADAALKAAVYQDVARELDRIENDSRPGVTVVVERQNNEGNIPDKLQTTKSPDGAETVNFGPIRYNVPSHCSITIANTSRVPATFSFAPHDIPGMEHQAVYPSWLSLHIPDEHGQSENTIGNPPPASNIPSQTTLSPGDALNIHMTLQVTSIEQVQSLNASTEALEDILVLRVLNGRDHFIPIMGQWQASVFGRSIDELVRVPEGGVRALDTSSSSQTSSKELKEETRKADQKGEEEVKWSAPRELFRLTGGIEDLIERIVAEWDMTRSTTAPWADSLTWPFSTSENHNRTTPATSNHEIALLENEQEQRQEQEEEQQRNEAAIREALDTDTPLFAALLPQTPALVRLDAAAPTLLAFLMALPDSIITASLWEALDPLLLTQGKDKTKKSAVESDDAQRMACLDVLGQQPSRSISLVFLTTLVGKIANEIAAVENDEDDANDKIKGKGGPQGPAERKEARTRSLLALFAGLVAGKGRPAEKEKEKRARLEKVAQLLRLFVAV